MQDDSFDAATVAFGIRNVAEIEKAFREMTRVVKPGGRVVCLEFAEPRAGAFRGLYDLLAVRDAGRRRGRQRAARRLRVSAGFGRPLPRAAPELAKVMQQAGLRDVRWVDLTFGLVCVHVGCK